LLALGPTGGVMGDTAANRADAGDFVAVDAAGTSFDPSARAPGQPQIKTDLTVHPPHIGLPMVDVQSGEIRRRLNRAVPGVCPS
jgi:N-methylhydantoinase A/oxoprolinase/acetone carboxylase beta subunit